MINEACNPYPKPTPDAVLSGRNVDHRRVIYVRGILSRLSREEVEQLARAYYVRQPAAFEQTLQWIDEARS